MKSKQIKQLIISGTNHIKCHFKCEHYWSTIVVPSIDNQEGHAPFVLRFVHLICFERTLSYDGKIYELIHRISCLLLSRNNRRFDWHGNWI